MKAWIYWLFMCGCLIACSKATEEDLPDGPEAVPVPKILITEVEVGLDWAKLKLTPDESAVAFSWVQGSIPRAGKVVDGNVERTITLRDLSPGATYMVSAVAWNCLGETGPEASLTFTTRLYQPSNYVEYEGVQYELSYAKSYITNFTSEEDNHVYFSLCLELQGKHGVNVLLTFNSERYDLIPYGRWKTGHYEFTEARDLTGLGTDGEITCVVSTPGGCAALTGTCYLEWIDDHHCYMSYDDEGVRIVYQGSMNV